MKRGRGTLCRDLTNDVDEFLRSRWDDAVATHLPFTTTAQKPLYGNLDFCH